MYVLPEKIFNKILLQSSENNKNCFSLLFLSDTDILIALYSVSFIFTISFPQFSTISSLISPSKLFSIFIDILFSSFLYKISIILYNCIISIVSYLILIFFFLLLPKLSAPFNNTFFFEKLATISIETELTLYSLLDSIGIKVSLLNKT